MFEIGYLASRNDLKHTKRLVLSRKASFTHSEVTFRLFLRLLNKIFKEVT